MSLLFALLFAPVAFAAEIEEDPYLWLEDVTGEEALAWVRERNAASTAELAGKPGFEALRGRLRAIYDSDDRIPYVGKLGEHLYNFWRDAEHPRGVWRRTTLASYRTDEPEWEVILDVDALGAAEGVGWVFAGSSCLKPTYDRCLISLSRGGADAEVVRELDVPSRTFVEGGFAIPEAKGGLEWIDRDHVYVATDFGDGSLTDSGYPRIVKEWTRGTPVEKAELVFEGTHTDIDVGAWHDDTPGFERDFVSRSLTFYTDQLFLRTNRGLTEVRKPKDARARTFRGWLLLELRSDWTEAGVTYPAGSLLATDLKKWMKGKSKLQVLFEPTPTTSLEGTTSTRGHLILSVLDDVKTRFEVLTPGRNGWARSSLPGAPAVGSAWVSAVDADTSDAFWLVSTDFLTPESLALGEIGGEVEVLKQAPAFFASDGLTVEQHFARSKDGTSVPYFQVGPSEPTGPVPTLLYGYGGFEISLTPYYDAAAGAAWLERGGVYAVANVRGGGEYGPRWHRAALRENRHRAYEDFAAVGRDLVDRGVTTPAQLGIEGASNGGLLMGAMYTLYPSLWGAVVCKVPLLDMKRYTKLLAGASWAAEYGDPDVPEDWAFLRTFSPYHNVDAAEAHPPMLLTTSTRDDRVHPGHARKMTAALLEGGQDVLYYENIEGGHGGAADNAQKAFMRALEYTFLWSRLGGDTHPN